MRSRNQGRFGRRLGVALIDTSPESLTQSHPSFSGAIIDCLCLLFSHLDNINGLLFLLTIHNSFCHVHSMVCEEI